MKKEVKITHQDVVRHVLKTDGNSFIFRSVAEDLPDYLICDNHYFGFVFADGGFVSNFILRMSPESAARYGKRHTVQTSAFPVGGDWYVLTLSGAFKKEEVYRILDECRDYTLRKFGAERSRIRDGKFAQTM